MSYPVNHCQMQSNESSYCKHVVLLLHLYAFPRLIALTTSSAMLNRSNKGCLIPDLRRKAFSLAPLSMIW